MGRKILYLCTKIMVSVPPEALPYSSPRGTVTRKNDIKPNNTPHSKWPFGLNVK